jgi:hypothetical protein
VSRDKGMSTFRIDGGEVYVRETTLERKWSCTLLRSFWQGIKQLFHGLLRHLTGREAAPSISSTG